MQTLRLLETFALAAVSRAIEDALRLGAISFDAVKHLLLCRIERRPARLDLENYPHLPSAHVTTTAAADYLALLPSRAAQRQALGVLAPPTGKASQRVPPKKLRSANHFSGHGPDDHTSGTGHRRVMAGVAGSTLVAPPAVAMNLANHIFERLTRKAAATGVEGVCRGSLASRYEQPCISVVVQDDPFPGFGMDRLING